MTHHQPPGRDDGPSQPGGRRRRIVDQALLFKAAGEPARVRILADLGRGNCDAASLCRHAGDDPKMLWPHLAALRRAGLVERRLVGGGDLFYALTDAGRAVAEIIARLVDGGSLPE